MGFNRMSVATLRDPEFVNITSISPLVSKCEVKVLYVGENRNRSFITKEVATEMAQTLPGCPIVGYYIEKKEDFGDHGDQIIIDAEGIKFKKLTKPYGFVAPNARVWFQEFEDTDEFGNKTVREYLMTEGFLWTEQYEECKRVIEMGNPQSMELDEKTLKGHWSVNTNTGVEFFIINDAIFSKLCILGDDVEPCFEGANVTAPEVSSKFSKDDAFVKNLFTMMEQLKYTLNNNEGGQLDMDGDLNNTIVEPVVDQPAAEENFSAELGNDNEIQTVENQNNIEEFTQDSVSSENDDNNSDAPSADDAIPADEFAKNDDEENEDDKKDKEDKNDDDEDAKKKFELLEAEHAELQAKYSALEASYQELVNFKNQIEDKEKDELIASFYMLTDEDKKDVIANKANYSLKEIKAELSMICVDKKVNFNLDSNAEENAMDKPFTYNLNQSDNVSKPAWLKAVEDTQKRLNK